MRVHSIVEKLSFSHWKNGILKGEANKNVTFSYRDIELISAIMPLTTEMGYNIAKPVPTWTIKVSLLSRRALISVSVFSRKYKENKYIVA